MAAHRENDALRAALDKERQEKAELAHADARRARDTAERDAQEAMMAAHNATSAQVYPYLPTSFGARPLEYAAHVFVARTPTSRRSHTRPTQRDAQRSLLRSVMSSRSSQRRVPRWHSCEAC